MLQEIDVKAFEELLEQALETVKAETTKSPSMILDAIISRISFRKSFLEVVYGIQMATEKRRSLIENCVNLLSKIVETMDLGKPSKGAFSPRIQKKLSICVPPRPMVAIDPKEAAKSMRLLLENLVEIDNIEKYGAPHEIWA